MKAKTYSALQKTYDQAYLTCSTAAYHGSQGNEVEALRYWRDGLGQLQSQNFSGHRPRSETERALLHSLKTMQDQCQEQVELIQALLISRVEAENKGQGLKNTSAGKSGLLTPPPLPSRFPTSLSGVALRGTSSPRASVSLAPPANAATTPPTHPITPPLPGPEQRAFLTTLRPVRKQKRPDSRIQNDGGEVTAAKAATLAWSSLSRAEGAHLSRTMTAPLLPTAGSLPVRQSFVASASTSNLSLGQRSSAAFTVGRRPSPAIPSRPALSAIRNSHASSLGIPGNPPYPDDDGRPPVPPPHGYFPPAGEHKRTRSGVPQGFGSPPPDPSPPVPDILPPPKDDEAEYYAPPAGYNGFVRPSPPPRDEEDSSDLHPESEVSPNDGEEVEKEQEEKEPPPKELTFDERVEKALSSIGDSVNMNAAQSIASEIVVKGDQVRWDDIAGLDAAKRALKETVVYPFLRPDLFSGLREPAKGMLLFGPPGTGKTMLARAVATESKSTFFSISASSLTSKYLGESEKLVRALFAMAKALSPSIIFVDEIDSILCSRGRSGENEASRRLKTEFLIQWSDLAKAAAANESTGPTTRVLVLAATNLPWEIDEAARRRFVRRQYVPLPEDETRRMHLQRLLASQKTHLSEEEMDRLIQLTQGYSGSDITALAKDAAMGPLRSLGEDLLCMRKEDIRPIAFQDFEASLATIKPSVSGGGVKMYEDWAKMFGERV